MRRNTAMTRRGFLGRTLTAAAAFPAIIPGSALGLNGAVAPSNRVTLACIGVGDRGHYLLTEALQCKEAQIVAACDVKAERRDAAAATINEFYGNKDCVTFNEHEAVTSRKDIDGVVIASCDHWHVLHALAAVRAGKGVYVEKPLGLTAAQDQAMRAAVKKHNAVFQFGTQQRSDAKFRKACELVRGGAIGELHTIYAWAPPSVAGGPTEPAPVPDTLDYDRWLGPAPAVPHTFERESNKWWWHISDYALGFIAGWGIHPVDIALWGAGDRMRTPFQVEGTGQYPVEGLCDTATDWKATCVYDSGLTVEFRAAPAPRDWLERFQAATEHGTAFVGDRGWVQVNRREMTCGPAELAKAEVPESAMLQKSNHHMRDFVTAVREKRAPVSHIDDAVTGDLFCHACDIALRMNRRLRWDSAAERFENADEANARLTRPMRAPWSLEEE
ncbi:MAG: Gfo/Idh/MocA family oxidoreductase [Candidatus Hydrogenedens sp.]|nr:Gfo/Idh/MocA family oxidoreductase [Candidatus Hydrogenedentota bacterium]NLF56781.1 Gfo/Idh/MocA family oxidoreductase [Candidatus Hydrogenedens sp.]